MWMLDVKIAPFSEMRSFIWVLSCENSQWFKTLSFARKYDINFKITHASIWIQYVDWTNQIHKFCQVKWIVKTEMISIHFLKEIHS